MPIAGIITMLQGGVKLYSTHTLYLFLYVAGTPVTVGVTMYILSISSVSEVMMVHKTLPLSLQLTLSLSLSICNRLWCLSALICVPSSNRKAVWRTSGSGNGHFAPYSGWPKNRKKYFVFPTYWSFSNNQSWARDNIFNFATTTKRLHNRASGTWKIRKMLSYRRQNGV